MNYYEVTVALMDETNLNAVGRPFKRVTKRVLQTAASEDEAKKWAEIETGGQAVHCQFLDKAQE